MPYQIRLSLKSNGELNLQKSSLLHGVLMEMASDSAYIDFLHKNKLHPFTQHLEIKNGNCAWVLSFLTEESFEKLYQAKLTTCQSFILKHNNQPVEITEREIQILSLKDLNDLLYNAQTPSIYRVEFITPTAFKSQGAYVIFPNLRLIYQSIMAKYDASYSTETLKDGETLEELCKASSIIGYNLRTVPFSLEGARINGFCGTITLKLSKNRTLNNFINLLFTFASYSGVGIKTTLGMGACRIVPMQPKSTRQNS